MQNPDRIVNRTVNRKMSIYIVIWLLLVVLLLIAFKQARAEMSPLSAEDAQFELWIRKTYDHAGIYHQETQDKVFIYVNKNWQTGEREWKYKAIRRLGCAARSEYAGELTPPYNIEILLLAPRRDGSVVTETVAAGNIDKKSCMLSEFLPILPPAKETAL